MPTKFVFVLGAAIAVTLVSSIEVPVNEAQRRVPPPPACNCDQIIISSSGTTKKLHSNVLGSFTRLSSYYNAFKGSIYRNSNRLTLIGGKLQNWRIQGGSRARRIVVKHPSCKEICPTNCSPNWVTYQKPRYVRDNTIKFECRNVNDGTTFFDWTDLTDIY